MMSLSYTAPPFALHAPLPEAQARTHPLPPEACQLDLRNDLQFSRDKYELMRNRLLGRTLSTYSRQKRGGVFGKGRQKEEEM